MARISEATRCPHCGALEALSAEVRRIRELAEAQAARTGPATGVPTAGPLTAADPDSQRRIAELTREVAELRATVARLRGSSPGGQVPVSLARAV